MTFKEWYKFNFEDNKLFNINDAYIKVFRRKSTKSEDMSFKTIIPIRDILCFFGDFNILFINYEKEDGYKALCFGLYKEEESK